MTHDSNRRPRRGIHPMSAFLIPAAMAFALIHSVAILADSTSATGMRPQQDPYPYGKIDREGKPRPPVTDGVETRPEAPFVLRGKCLRKLGSWDPGVACPRSVVLEWFRKSGDDRHRVQIGNGGEFRFSATSGIYGVRVVRPAKGLKLQTSEVHITRSQPAIIVLEQEESP